MAKSITRHGNLGFVFGEGNSVLLNAIARLCILYEDIRLELNQLRQIQERRAAGEVLDSDDFQVAYFMRRALVTLVEFRRALTRIRGTQEFKHAIAFHPKMEKDDLLPVEQFFQQHEARIKELRNEFGGHLQEASVKFATGHVSDVSGKITMNLRSEGWTMGLECDFVSQLMAGIITSKLAGKDYKGELGEAIEMMGTAFGHVQVATVALVYMFLWDRFGK
jgi:hypothetical protein